jgi:hypothetical protein
VAGRRQLIPSERSQVELEAGCRFEPPARRILLADCWRVLGFLAMQVIDRRLHEARRRMKAGLRGATLPLPAHGAIASQLSSSARWDAAPPHPRA